MEKEFIPYTESLALKELNAYIECFGFYWFNGSSNIWVLETKEYEDEYSKTISVPTFSQAFRFFREKYNLFGYPFPNDYQNYGYRIVEITSDENKELVYDWGTKDTCEDAELACLKKLIEIVKER